MSAAMPFRAILRQELALAASGGWSSFVAVLFYVAVAVLVPFAVGPDGQLLAIIAGGMAWIAALLALLLTLERLFQPDREDGALDQWIAQGVPLEVLAMAKIAAHWLVTALPLLLATPIVAVLLNLHAAQTKLLLVSLVIGTPGLSALGAICAALAVSVRRAGVLIALLVLPLAVPVLIFGVASLGSDTAAALKFLGACSLILLTLAPFAIKAALKISVE